MPVPMRTVALALSLVLTAPLAFAQGPTPAPDAAPAPTPPVTQSPLPDAGPPPPPPPPPAAPTEPSKDPFGEPLTLTAKTIVFVKGNGTWDTAYETLQGAFKIVNGYLDKAGVKADAKEFVFFGADHGEEEVEFRADKFKVDQNFGRSLPREKALAPEPILVWELNGEPLSVHQGFPLRLIVPGWYGVANVKWLSQIHLQAEEYLGKYQARWYRTLRGENIGGTTIWKESAVTLQQPKSFIARVTKAGSAYKALVVVLNDGSPIKSVEVKVDEGPWQAATADPATKDRFGWKLYTFTWNGATKGEHTLVSRLTETSGRVQPTADELASKKTFLEDNSQHPRKLTIA